MTYSRTTNDLSEEYTRKIHSIPLLSSEEEYVLAKKWRDEGDDEAAGKLVSSHLRLVNKIAHGYRGYGLPLADLVAEGHVGVMQAMKNFDPERGFRFSTYAMWWIKASIQEYVLNTWSLVKIGTTASQKKLFFKLRKIKQKLGVSRLHPEHIKHISEELDIKEEVIRQMEERMGGADYSLNSLIRDTGESESEWIEWFASDTEDQEMQLLQKDELRKRKKLLSQAFQSLRPRERDIIIDRRLHEPPFTLEDLSQKYGISRERVRQIEIQAFEKLQKAVKFNIFGKNY